MKLSQIRAQRAALGKRAERHLTFSLTLGDTTEDVDVVLVPLTGEEEALVLVHALEYSKAKGGKGEEGDSLYDLAIMAKTVELGVCDPDSPETARTAFADGGVDQVLQLLGRETIAYLHEAQQHWQDLCSPSIRKVSAEQLIDIFVKIAESDSELPFVRLSPGLRWICMRTMARLLLSSLGDSLDTSSLSAAIGGELQKRP